MTSFKNSAEYVPPANTYSRYFTMRTTPSAPTSLVTAGNETRILLEWTDNSNNEDGFKIERKQGSGNWSEIDAVSANDDDYSDNPSRCLVYTYRVRAYNGIGASAYTSEQTDMLSPRTPANLTATPSETAIVLNWDANLCSNQGFLVQRKTGLNGTWGDLNNLLGDITGYSDTSALLDIDYFYRVRAYHDFGESSFSNEASGRRSTQYTITTSAGANGSVTPTGNVLRNRGSDVTFTATPASGYEVDTWTLNGASAQSGGTTYTLANLQANHTLIVSFKSLTYSIAVEAKLNGTPWSGSLEFQIQGANNISGTALPFSADEQPFGSYSVRHISGGPNNAYLSHIEAISVASADSIPKGNPVVAAWRFILYFIKRESPQLPTVTQTTVTIRYPSVPGISYALMYTESLTDTRINWIPLEEATAQSELIEFQETDERNHPERYYHVRPINAEGFFWFPLRHKTPYTVELAAVFDHDVSPGSHLCSNGIVVAYTGEKGLALSDNTRHSVFFSTDESVSCPNDKLYGFKQDANGTPFIINNHYTGGPSGPDGTDSHRFLFYDGHSGHDFVANEGDDVLAAADGIVTDDSYPLNGVVVTHTDGYKTYYLHLQPASRLKKDTEVKARKTVVGKVGIEKHVHFTVTKNGVRLDPYGWEGEPTKDPWQVNGHDNRNLWKDLKMTFLINVIP